MKRIKNIISFIYPVMIEAKEGVITPYLEVMKYRGKLTLNSHNANYSNGGMYTIFDSVFKKIDINKYDFKNVLLLGMGAGSIVSLLTEKYKCKCNITAIEKDEVVIELAKKYFNIERFANLSIVQGDAFSFVAESDDKYDLIIVDLFIDGDVPKKFASKEFLNNLKKISNKEVCVVYNKMTESAKHKAEFKVLEEDFTKLYPEAKVHKIVIHGTENSLLYNNTLPKASTQLKPNSVVTINN